VAEEQGQAETQPETSELSPQDAVAMLSEEIQKREVPRDEKGKFVPKQEVQEEKAESQEEAPAEEAPEAAPEEPEIKPEPRRYKLKYKGEEIERTEEEVIALAQQGHDYTQKSQALAKEREEAAAKVRAEVESRQKEYEQNLEIHKRALEKLAGFEEVDLNKLSQEDPVKAQQEFFKRVAFNQQLQTIQAEQQKIAQQRQSEMQASIRKQAEASVEALQSKIPGWGNDLYGKVLKTAVKDYGFQQQEVNAITDHRAIEVLHDAMKWRELKAAKPQTVDKKVAAVPKVQKPGTAEKADPKAKRMVDSEARLKKSGSRDDAVAHIRELLDAGIIS